MLELATTTTSGNPWLVLSLRQRTGGAKRRMFERMQAKGWFDRDNRITPEGRAALHERLKGGGA